MKLYKHQEQVLNATKNSTKVAYYLDMGLGKTFVGSEKMCDYGNPMNLVICQKSKVDDWVGHFQEHYPDAVVWNLTKKTEFENFKQFCVEGWTHIAVINYELAWRRKDLLSLQNFTLMLDESSLIQNDTAKRTKFILSMNPSNVILLSGTPTSGKYENLWTQIHLLGWKISKDTYNKQYINWKKINVGGFPQWIVDKDDPYKNIDRLKSKMREHGAVFLKTEECFDLPSQTFTTVNCGSSKEYKKFKKDSIITIDTLNLHEFKDDSDFYGKDVTPRVELVGDTTLTKMLYLRMLCGQYSKDKLDAFKDLVQSTNDRLIVFYNFKEEAKKLIHIANELDRPWAIISGDTKNLAAYDNHDNSITFVQYQAGSMGLNLQKANKIVYFTLPLMSEHYEQSKKRIHRIGQERPCFYYLMLCKGTIEEDILQTLELRRNYTDELFKENNNVH